MAASYLFLRPAIRAGLVRGLSDKSLADWILAPYLEGIEVPVQGSRSCGRALSMSIRHEGFERLRVRCAAHGITLHVCGCKNPDLTNTRCHLVRSGPPGHIGSESLFSG